MSIVQHAIPRGIFYAFPIVFHFFSKAFETLLADHLPY